jgi:hypothetical protein
VEDDVGAGDESVEGRGVVEPSEDDAPALGF